MHEAFMTHFVGLSLSLVLAVIYGRIGRQGVFWMVLLSLPQTVCHELCHLVVGLVTGARVSGFSIFPRPEQYRRREK